MTWPHHGQLADSSLQRCVTFDISEWAAGPHPQAGHPVSLSLHWSMWRAEIQAWTSCYTPARSLWSSADGSLGRTPSRFGGSNMDRVVLGKIGKSPWCCSAFPRTSPLHLYGINALKKHLKLPEVQPHSCLQCVHRSFLHQNIYADDFMTEWYSLLWMGL